MPRNDFMPSSVLMVCPQYLPLIGGYEKAAERLSAGLVARGIAVEVVSERRDKAWPEVERSNGVIVRRLPCLYKSGYHTLSSLLALAVYLLAKGKTFDVWHVHQYGVHAALCSAMGALLKRPVVLKLTSTGLAGITATLEQGPFPKLSSLLHRRVRKCIVTSIATYEEAYRFGIPKQRIAIAGNGIDTELFLPASPADKLSAKQRLGVTSPLLVLWVGRFSWEKNPLGMLEAWSRVVPEIGRSAVLGLVGSGPMLETVRQEIGSRKLEDSVFLAGESKDVLSWYRAADVFVMTSHLEGLSNSMLEALACGLPLLATRVSGCSDAVEEGRAGILAAVDDMESLANGLLTLLRDTRLREQYGRAARGYVIARYTIDRAVDQVMEIYRTLN